MRAIIFFLVLFFAATAHAGQEVKIAMGCGTSGVTYYAYEFVTNNFFEVTTPAFDSLTYNTESATQIGGASSLVWKTDQLPVSGFSEIMVVFLNSESSECNAVIIGR